MFFRMILICICPEKLFLAGVQPQEWGFRWVVYLKVLNLIEGVELQVLLGY